jgi:hypothetical protein
MVKIYSCTYVSKLLQMGAKDGSSGRYASMPIFAKKISSKQQHHLLYQTWFLSKNVTVFPKLFTLLRLGILNKVCAWQFHVKISTGFMLVGKMLYPLPELAYYNVMYKGLNNIRVQ